MLNLCSFQKIYVNDCRYFASKTTAFFWRPCPCCLARRYLLYFLVFCFAFTMALEQYCSGLNLDSATPEPESGPELVLSMHLWDCS